MTASIIKIGNSRGIRIPKKLLDQYHMDGQVELIVSDEGLLLKPLQKPRAGWSERFAAAGPDEEGLLLDDVFSDEEVDKVYGEEGFGDSNSTTRW